ncbi:MAG: class I SAM-dependent methyltransferase [Gordonia sp. (in: high G+C Gram-positive bacteria)]|uniref:class I SAM-dependent methyltransferase n=1 Tax=Gordonia sp. (in: high G+C Gram-positive bacteria) TaxID=84139 RepID=UPI0039E6DF31
MHQHGNPAQSSDDTPADARAFWEDFYGDGKRPWTGKPNAILVDEVSGIDADGAAALDLGCGSGADAIWLAQQGWRVTAVDIAEAALVTGREHARDADVPAAAIDWQRCDLSTDFPTGTWDLISACYLHSKVDLEREQILRRAAAAVAPGGHLIVIGHWAMPEWRFPDDPPRFPSTDDVLAMLDLDGWAIIAADTREVAMTDPDGNPAARTDNVVHLRRP